MTDLRKAFIEIYDTIAFKSCEPYLSYNRDIENSFKDQGWFRFHFENRLDYIQIIPKVFEILDKYDVTYDYSNWKEIYQISIFVSAHGRTDMTKQMYNQIIKDRYFEHISDTTDSLYDKDFFKLRDELDIGRCYTNYKRTKDGVIIGFWTQKDAKLFNEIFPKHYSENGLNWSKNEEKYEPKYGCLVRMKDKPGECNALTSIMKVTKTTKKPKHKATTLDLTTLTKEQLSKLKELGIL